MSSQWWANDDQLLDMLGDALRAGPVPPQLIQAGKRAFLAHDIDAQVAALVYDSAFDDQPALTATRAEAEVAALRSMRFTGAALTIEVEIADDAIYGQLLPPQPGVIRVQPSGDEDVVIPADDTGGFVIRPVPSAAFRLRCHTAGGVVAITDLISLEP